jgi:DNA invertase Pin-like site-specific DNA recombinase
MKTQEAIKIFGSVRGIAKALGISVQAVHRWGDSVPRLRAYQIRDLLAVKTSN